MGTQGVPLRKYSKSEISKVIKDYKGRLTYAASALGICYQSLRNLIDPHPDLVKLVADCRHDFETSLLDTAEDTLSYAMAQKKEDLTNALKSTFFVLNNKGKARGYFPPNYKETVAEGDVDEIRGAVQDLKANAGDTAPSGQKMADEPPLLHQAQGSKGSIPTELGSERSTLRLPPV